MKGLARIGYAAGAVFAALFFQSVYHLPVPELGVVLLTLYAVTAFANPGAALLLLASLGPLAAAIWAFVGKGLDLHFSEAITLAFLTGSLTRRAVSRKIVTLAPSLVTPGIALVALASAWAAANGARLLAEQPNLTIATIVNAHVMRGDPVTAAVQFAEGPLLLLAVVATCAAGESRRRTLRMMVVGAAGAAALNLTRLITVSRQQAEWPASFATNFLNLRVNVHYGDLNAAGSYFAMMLVIAIGFADDERWWAYVCATLLAVALWLSGSRTAMAAFVIVAVAMGVRALRRADGRRRTVIVATFAALAAATAVAWAVYPHYRNDRPRAAVYARTELAKAGWEMTKSHPLAGVGPGRFYELSSRYVTPELGMQANENAHNNFIQVAAELGVPGLAFLLWLLAASLWYRSGTAEPGGALLAGIGVYLLTCLTGHPLLVPEAAYPFWMAVGIAAASRAASSSSAKSGRHVVFVGLLLAVLAITLSSRLTEARNAADRSNTSIGLSLWQHLPDGSRFRWAGLHCTFYIPSWGRVVRIPLRPGPGIARPFDVRVFVDEREANRLRLAPGESWATLVLEMRDPGPAAYRRIDLAVEGVQPPVPPQSDTGGVLMVGRPNVAR